MTSPDPKVKNALDLLNEALARDPLALTQLLNARVSCNERLVKHPTIQVGLYDGEAKLGILGLINGLLGYKRGGIGAEGDVDPRTGRFIRIRRFVHTKAGLNVRT